MTPLDDSLILLETWEGMSDEELEFLQQNLENLMSHNFDHFIHRNNKNKDSSKDLEN